MERHVQPEVDWTFSIRPTKLSQAHKIRLDCRSEAQTQRWNPEDVKSVEKAEMYYSQKNK